MDAALTDRRGVSLVIALVVMALGMSLAIVAVGATVARVRLLSAARWASEGDIVADGALASVRVANGADLDTIPDGATELFGPVDRGDGWSWSVRATRRSALVRLVAQARRFDAAGSELAERAASLLLVVTGADTVRVLVQRPRF